MFQCVLGSYASRQAASKEHRAQADAEQPEPHEAAKGTRQLAEGSKVSLLAHHKDEVALVIDNRCGELFATYVRTAKAANADLCLTRCQLWMKGWVFTIDNISYLLSTTHINITLFNNYFPLG